MIPYHEFKPHIKSDDEVNLFTEANWMQYQWRIQDFPEGARQLPKLLLFFNFFTENCMKMKEFGPPGGVLAPPPLDPPVNTLYLHNNATCWIFHDFRPLG